MKPMPLLAMIMISSNKIDKHTKILKSKDVNKKIKEKNN